MCSATDTTVLIEQDSVENGVSIDRATNVPQGLKDTVPPAAPIKLEAEPATPSMEYIVDRIAGHCTTRGGI